MPLCPVCGYPELKEPPRSKSGGGSYEICPCCGFQFGVDDDDRGLSYEAARERWVGMEMPWYSKSRSAPEGWSAAGQLASLSSSEAKKPKAPAKKKTAKADEKKPVKKKKKKD